ncbi:SusC/RagA family TonB-linked outer membrane protein [Mariniflexile jejuense]|uniref:SusC/RagA family TonB-linked outer membrane protein n=1 Tax=Mariniflexile jejuense TaxID=1173582 RepID=A0ABW3JI50_9FLAO
MKTKKNFKYYFLLLGILFYLPNYAQNVSSVKGTVTDETGVPLPGVSIIIKNTTKGTATDFDGNFSINANSKDILVFSFLGFKTQEISVSGKSTINISLVTDSSQLDEVVVIGYGSTTRRDVTGAISSVTGEKLAAVPVPDAAQALQGKLPGVNVTTQDGRPGANISIRVRGGGSISQSNQPLFIVDGFPVSSISNIPGSQIQSIDVLKDASSTAIYGARGANGVIIVTTKSGKVGKTTVTYDGYTQYSVIPKYIPVMNGYDYIAYNWAYADAIGSQYRDAWEKLWLIGSQSGSNTAGIDYYKTVKSRDYTKELYNSAFTHNHNFNLSSGNENTRYLLAFNHLDQEGNKVGSGYERSNVSLKLDQKLGSKLDFSLNTRYAQEKELDNDGNSTAYYFRPINTVDVLGDLDVTSNSQLGDYNSILQDAFNPAAILNDNFNSNTKRSLVANSALSWKILEGLTAKTDLGLSVNWSRRKVWTGAYANNYINPSTGEKTFGGNARLVSSEGWNLRWVNTLNYEVQGLGDDHKLSLLAGMEVADSGSESIDARGVRYPKAYDADRAFANLRDYDTTQGDQNFFFSNVAPANRLQSYFGRVNYSLLDKYLLTATLRADGSSRFAPSNRWGYFPAAALAWRASKEDFLKEATWIDDLKVRLSYGSVGSDAISSELWKQSWASGVGTYSINEVLQPNYTPASALLANPDLKWETTITRNLGVDFSILNSKLSGTIEVYKNTVKDLLLVSPVSGITGFEFTQENIGQTSNKGIEISLNADLVTSEDFNLQASINVNVNKGNIDKLADGVEGSYGSGWGGVAQNPREDYVFEVGKPVGLIRGYTHDGWYTTDDFDYNPTTQIYTLKSGVADYASGVLGFVYGTNSNKPGSQTAYPGVQKAKDLNGDGLIDDQDITIIGDVNPAHTGGFSLSGNYKAFDFALNFNWSVGNDIYNATHQQAYLGNKEAGLYRNRYQELAGHYKIYDIINGQLTKVLDPAALDALNANATTHLPYPESTIVSTFAIEDGSFLRLNTATLGYTLSKSVVDRFGINRFRVYGSVYNVFTITGYNGFDPEVNTDATRSQFYPTPGLDFGSYPRSRTFTFGVNVEF